MSLHKVFISYHHQNDQSYKNLLIERNRIDPIFIDRSVNTGDISDFLEDQAIRQKIRDDYLRDSTVTIVLVGTQTKSRKHIDWEIYSSMYDGLRNKKSGILVINLPTINCSYFNAAHDGEKETVYSGNTSWVSIDSRSEYQRRYPYMPDRIIDNLLHSDAKISVVNWEKIYSDWNNLNFLIAATAKDRTVCDYDLSRPMRRANS